MYSVFSRGPKYEVSLPEDNQCTVTDLLQELYHKAGALKIWWLIRYTAGMLRKRVSSLASVSIQYPPVTCDANNIIDCVLNYNFHYYDL